MIIYLVLLLCCGCINDGKNSAETATKSNINNVNWVQINESNISFSIPKTMKKENFQPIDSFAFRYSNKFITIAAEEGVYAPSLSSYKDDINIIRYEERKLELLNNQAIMATIQFAKGKGNFQDKGKKFGKIIKINCESENDSFTILILFSEHKHNITNKIIESISVKCPPN